MHQLKRIKAGRVLGIIAAIYIGVYLVETIHHNYQLQKQVDTLQGQINEVENEKQALKYRIQYYQTDAYKEKQARAKLGLQAPGEGVIILPHPDDPKPQVQTKQEPKHSHFRQWVDFLRGHTQ